ncbi:hypothetical protein BGW38_002801 [Lunasporangiospora selenospora]|uniref:Uncharacterized protein n=1 Tax=Lunasporangiospora selenospora TaxID=979761 RepID=A0A9P6G0V8_9FUNG|nr:hypothetical protein BGW38_002801 [Lunasporangiospora selenospora]
MGGTIVRATGTIMTIVYIDMVCSLIALFFCLFVVPESLPAKQPAFIRRLYESALGHRAEDGSHDHGNKHNAAVGSWYSHATRSLSFFKPNGRNTNLILLGIISFLQMLAFRGTMSVIILYTNQMFNWTEYEDGIMFSSSSIARLVTLMVVLPILVHYYQKYTKRDNSLRRIRSESSAGKQPDYESKSRPDFGTTSDKSLTNPGSSSDPQLYTGSDAGNQMVFNPNDPSIAASIQHLGESALDFSSDEDSDIASGPVSWQTPKRGDSQSTLPVLLSGERHRHESIDSITTLGPNSGLEGSSSSKGQRPEAESSHPTLKRSASTAAFRSKEQAYNDIKFDTWMVRLGFSINSITYVGYALATEGWLFILAAVLHAVCIIASPSMKSLLMSVVEPTQFGAVLGAIQIVESVAAIVSPIVISGSYALTVKTMPEFVWYSCAGWTGICVILSFMIRQKQFRSNMPGV